MSSTTPCCTRNNTEKVLISEFGAVVLFFQSSFLQKKENKFSNLKSKKNLQSFFFCWEIFCLNSEPDCLFPKFLDLCHLRSVDSMTFYLILDPESQTGKSASHHVISRPRTFQADHPIQLVQRFLSKDKNFCRYELPLKHGIRFRENLNFLSGLNLNCYIFKPALCLKRYLNKIHSPPHIY